MCHGPIQQKHKGPDRETCSDRCRQALWRVRQREQGGAKADNDAARAELRALRERDRQVRELLTSPTALQLLKRDGDGAKLIVQLSRLFPPER